MKIKVWSDLHLEFGASVSSLFENWNPCDVLVLAGDISSGAYILDDLSDIFYSVPEETKVIYVPGNHEYYGETIEKRTKQLRDFCSNFDRVCFLNRDSINIDGVCFAGCVGWMDGSTGDGSPLNWLSTLITDFQTIKGFTLDSCLYEGAKDSDFLYRNTANIYVTHNGCSFKSIAPRYERSTLNPYFVNDYTDIIEKYLPSFWIHGHTHDCLDYKLGDTRVICNSKGYPTEYIGFNKHLYINYEKDRYSL